MRVQDALWLVIRKDIPVESEPSYVTPWEVLFNWKPRTFVYRQEWSARRKAKELDKVGGLFGLFEYRRVE